MSGLIRLTKTDGFPVYLAPEHIRAVTWEMRSPFSESGRDYVTKVYEEGEGCWWVKETPEEVARKVREYRVATQSLLIAYRIGLEKEVKVGSQDPGNEISYWERILDHLAGFEKEKSTAGTVE
ncbi:MAG: hypothetical protein BLM47_00215 [Candidatus Reconcilbacillus cellulovorans]|uniref:Uncharacterized protein n=1 Tax=Candidatus Reconcilbacillus cellulovorans TaxID=1906605 RepID=A0A2A6E3M8_9BACL|nr:MAG: hypothetical protein BLM47_00215 [Candidatus Reconcilbacillus cellulovorans]